MAHPPDRITKARHLIPRIRPLTLVAAAGTTPTTVGSSCGAGRPLSIRAASVAIRSARVADTWPPPGHRNVRQPSSTSATCGRFTGRCRIARRRFGGTTSVLSRESRTSASQRRHTSDEARGPVGSAPPRSFRTPPRAAIQIDTATSTSFGPATAPDATRGSARRSMSYAVRERSI